MPPRPSLNEGSLARLEGKLQQLRERARLAQLGDPDGGLPKMLPVDFLAQELAVSRVTIRNWVRASKSSRIVSTDIQDRFTEVYDQFCQLFAARPVEKVHDIANDPKNSQSLAALKWLLPKIDPNVWGDHVGADDDESTGVHDIPREVLDDLSEDELLQIETYQREIEERMEATAKIIAQAKARVAARAVERLEH